MQSLDNLTRIPGKAVCRGVYLNGPQDLIPPLKFPVLVNLRSYEEGVIETRAGSAAVAATAMDGIVHSIMRLNDDLPGASLPWIRICGAGTKLYSGQAPAPAAIDTGYDGLPLSFVAYRPPNSPQSWAYIGNANKMRKTDVSGTVRNMGISTPNTEPSVVLAAPNYKVVGDFDTSPPAGWTGVDTSALTIADRLKHGGTVNTIAAVLYDTGTTGWICISPTTMDDAIQPGLLILADAAGGSNAEVFVVHDVINFTLSTTIAAIIYDSGTTGLCSIALTLSSDAIRRDALLKLDNAGHTNTEYVRVLSATVGPDGTKSIRCSTVNAHIATDTVVAYPCLRAFTTKTRIATDTIVSNCVIGSTTGTAVIATMTSVAALDLGTVGGRPISRDDYMHVSLNIDNLDNVVEIKVMLDVDAAGGSAGTVFTENFYYYTISPSFLQPSASDQLSLIATLQRQIEQQQIAAATDVPFQGMGYFPTPGGPVGTVEQLQQQLLVAETSLGATQWSEVKFKLNPESFIRVGSDTSRTLNHVCAIRIQFTVSSTVNFKVNSWWIGGTYGPDSDILGYSFRTRPRSTVTGAKGNPSPATRFEVDASRDRIIVTGAIHSDAQVDVIDFFQFGGALTSWKYIGTVPNTGTPVFNEDQDDISLQNAEDLELDNFVPFPTIDIPRAGVCDVAGTTIKRVSGDTFNTRWGAGSQIIINGIAYTIDRAPTSTLIQIAENAGAATSATWKMPNPTLLEQPLGRMWGPYLETIFACGDPYQPGVLHATKASNPDSSPEKEQYEICGPSEPLINGGIFDNNPFVFSSKNLYAGKPTGSNKDGERWFWQLVPSSRGLYAPWGLAVGELVYFITSDGIYETLLGGEPVSITDADLYDLFPHEGQPGKAVNGFCPPDMTLVNSLRLNWAYGYLYFDYIDANGLYRTLTYHVAKKAWYPDVYPNGMVTHHEEEGKNLNSVLLGGADGKLYTMGGLIDSDGLSVWWHLRWRSLDKDDSRAKAFWHDAMLDIDTGGTNVIAVIGFDEHTAVLPFYIVNTLGRQDSDPPILDLPALELRRTISIDLTPREIGSLTPDLVSSAMASANSIAVLPSTVPQIGFFVYPWGP